MKVAILFLWIAIGLMQQNTALSDRSSHRKSASTEQAAPAVKKPAPVFTLVDTQGQKRKLAEFRGRPITLFFFCGCQWCHECGQAWSQLQRSGALPQPGATSGKQGDSSIERSPLTLVVFQGDAEAACGFAAETGLDLKQTVLLPDPNLAVTQTYRALPCPRAFVLDGQGLVRYTNNHADDAPQKAPALAIVSRVVDALRACAANPAPAPTQTKSPPKHAPQRHRQRKEKTHAPP